MNTYAAMEAGKKTTTTARLANTRTLGMAKQIANGTGDVVLYAKAYTTGMIGIKARRGNVGKCQLPTQRRHNSEAADTTAPENRHTAPTNQRQKLNREKNQGTSSIAQLT